MIDMQAVALKLYGITIKEAHTRGICVRCREEYVLDDTFDEIGRFLANQMYGLTGLCDTCYGVIYGTHQSNWKLKE